jgi:acyl dehydratase
MITVSVHEVDKLVGQVVGKSDWFAIDQARVNGFADATNDHQWIHVDVDRAARERNGTIAHGYLVLSLIPHLLDQVISISDTKMVFNYGIDRVRFLDETKVADDIRLGVKVSQVTAKEKGSLIGYECTVEGRSTGKILCVAHLLGLHVPQD